MSNLRLIDQLHSERHLGLALDRLRRASRASGVDKVTPAQFRERRAENLADISRRLKSGTYQFQRLKAAPVPKESGGHRLLAIPTVADRVVQKALLHLVMPFIEAKITSPGSHAYLSRRGVSTAVNDVKRHITKGRLSIVKTDIVKFFDEIKAHRAIAQLTATLPDDSLNALLQQYVGWEVDGVKHLPADIRNTFPADGRIIGLPQGTALAPVLANLVLGDIDRDAETSGFKVVRYADDIVFLAPTLSEALVAFDWYKSRLAALHLRVHDPRNANAKALIIDDVRNSGLEYLGYFIKPAGKRISIRPQESKIQGIGQKIDKILRARGRESFPQRIVAASQCAEAWIASYRSLCGMKRLTARIYNDVAKSIENVLQDRGILAVGKSLDSKQRAFLGFRLDPNKRQVRPSRAFVRKASRNAAGI